MDLGELKVKLTAATADFVAKMKEAEKTLDRFEKGIQGMAAISTAAFAGLSVGIWKAVEAAGEAEAAERKLEAAIRGSGQAIDVERIKQYAVALQQVTTYGDDTTVEAAAMLATFQLTENQILALLPRVQNLASMYEMDLTSAAVQVGKALTGSAGALSRYGITLSDAEKEAYNAGNQTQRLAMMLGILDKNTGPAARAMATTAVGAFKQMSNALGDVMEEIGKLVDSPLGSFFNAIKTAANVAIAALQSMPGTLKSIIGYGALGATAVAGLSTALLGVAMAIGSSTLQAGFKTFGLMISTATKSVWGLHAAMFKLIAMGAAAAGAIAAATGFARIAMMSDEERAAEAQKAGIGPETGFAEGMMKGAARTMALGFETMMAPISVAMGALSSKLDGLTPNAEQLDKDLASVDAAVSRTTSGMGKLGDTLDFSSQGAMDGFSHGLEDLETQVNGFDFAELGTAEEKFKKALGDLSDDVNDTTPSFAEFKAGIGELGKAMLNIKRTPGAEFGQVSSMLDAGSRTGSTEMKSALQTGEQKSIEDAREAFRGPAQRIAGAIGESAGNLAQMMLSNMGEAGGVISNAIQGFRQGGIFGAIGAVAQQFISKAPAFQEAQRDAGRMLASLGEAFAALAKAIKPLAVMLNTLLVHVGKMLVPVFEALGVVFRNLFSLIKWLAIIILNIIRGLGSAWNGLMSVLSATLDWIPGAGDDIKRLFDRAKFNLNGIDRMIGDLHDLTVSGAMEAGKEIEDPASGAGDALDDFGDKLLDVSEQLSNVPDGYKIALRKFQSIIGEPAPLATAGVLGAASSRQSSLTYVANIGTVQASDPDEMRRQIEAEARWSQVVNAGTPLPTAPSYVGG